MWREKEWWLATRVCVTVSRPILSFRRRALITLFLERKGGWRNEARWEKEREMAIPRLDRRERGPKVMNVHLFVLSPAERERERTSPPSSNPSSDRVVSPYLLDLAGDSWRHDDGFMLRARPGPTPLSRCWKDSRSRSRAERPSQRAAGKRKAIYKQEWLCFEVWSIRLCQKSDGRIAVWPAEWREGSIPSSVDMWLLTLAEETETCDSCVMLFGGAQ